MFCSSSNTLLQISISFVKIKLSDFKKIKIDGINFNVNFLQHDLLSTLKNKSHLIFLHIWLIKFFKKQSVKPSVANPILEKKGSSAIKQSDKLFKIFSRPNITMDDVLGFPEASAFVKGHEFDAEIIEQAEIQVKYSGYIKMERNNADKLSRLEYVKIPPSFDYSKIQSMSYEAREKLTSVAPETVAQASRISGVSPNDISVLLVYMGR